MEDRQPRACRRSGLTELIEGDCREVLADFEGVFHAMVTDPPGGLGMGERLGQDWDCFRRARNPNDAGRDSVFGRTSRTSPHSYGETNRDAFVEFMAEAMTLARRALIPGANCLVWAFPRTSHWTAYALENAGFEIRDVVTHLQAQGMPKSHSLLKPASEHWILCRTPGPLRELGIDRCRIPRERKMRINSRSQKASDETAARGVYGPGGAHGTYQAPGQELGGWPMNVVLSHDEECGDECAPGCPVRHLGDNARFFTKFVPKAAPKERRAGLAPDDELHPTVKSIELMRWLVSLVAESGEILMDPFAGTCTTAIAAEDLGVHSVSIDRHPPYLGLGRKRIEFWRASRNGSDRI